MLNNQGSENLQKEGMREGGRPSVAAPCTGRPLTESDNTRCCIIQFCPPDDEHIVLETCRGI